MREIHIFFLLVMTTFVTSQITQDNKNVNKRDTSRSAELDEYLRPPPVRQNGRAVTKFSDADIVIVNPPKMVADRIGNLQRREDMQRITMIPSKPLHGYLKLKPVGNDWLGLHNANEGVASNYRNIYQKTTPFRPQERVINLTTPRPRPSMSIGQRLARWFFSTNEEEEDSQTAGSAPKQNLVRPPPTYEKFPPFWPEPKRSQRHQQKGPQGHPNSNLNSNGNGKWKKDCNECNSVPWIPMPKSNGVSENVISLVNPPSSDSSGVYSAPSIAVLPPAPILDGNTDATISTSFGLPAGNLPTGHGLLPPVINLQPVVHQAIPFPEMSPVPLAPIYDAKQFQFDDTKDLVPPLPPKAIGNVIFTISEHPVNEPQPPALPDQYTQPPIQFQHHYDQQYQQQIQHNLIQQDQTPSGSHQNQHQNGQYLSNNVQIVKSVPLAEYTSSIEYPLQLVQAGPIIDIHTNNSSRQTTYEKQSQTGDQKISDIILGNDKKKDSDAAGSALSETTDRGETPKQGKSDQIFTTPHMQSFQNSYRQDGHHFLMNNVGSDVNKQLDSNILTPPPLPPDFSGSPVQFYNPVPAYTISETPQPYLNPPHRESNFVTSWISTPIPYLIDSGIASIINGGLLPPAAPSQTLPEQKPKKIQIIIPYTTIDQNTLSSMQQQQSTFLPDITVNLTTNRLSLESSHTFMPMVTEPPPQQARKVSYQTFENFKNTNASTVFSETQQSFNRTDFKHILANNIRQLLKGEVEAKAQNIRLQKNIDDWTALEYSNHKVTTKKQPVEVISNAQAVTNIPGTSISHLLLPSKKIPDNYFTTTPIPKFDEPTTTQPNPVSVNSRPFTTNTENIYKINLLNLENIKEKSKHDRLSQLSNYANQQNHKNGYTVVQKFKPNTWGKLKENLILPEEKENDDIVTTTGRTSWEDVDVSISPITKEKVYVVTPVSRLGATEEWSFEKTRTTRHIGTTEKYQNTAKGHNLLEVSKASDTQSVTEKYEKQVIGKNVLTVPHNSTKLVSKPFRPKQEIITPKTPILSTVKPQTSHEKHKVKQDSTPLFKIRSNKTISKFNKPKPIQKFFPTINIKSTTTTATQKSSTDEQLLTTSRPSLNDVFPFRNGGEVPLEMQEITNSFSDVTRKPGDKRPERKTLIKQKNINNKRLRTDPNDVRGTPVAEIIEVDLSTLNRGSTTITNRENNSSSSPITEKPKTHVTKRSTTQLPSSTTQSQQPNQTSSIKPDEPNITIEERDQINELSREEINKNDTDDLIAVESKNAQKMPKGVFGETTKIERVQDRPNFETLKDTINLLREFIRDSLNETDEKTESDQKLRFNLNFKDHDKLLEGLEKLKPVMDENKKPKSSGKTETKYKNVKDSLKTLESKLMKNSKTDKKQKNYIYNFPEYVNSSVNLSHEEMDLLEGAIVELKKSKQKS